MELSGGAAYLPLAPGKGPESSRSSPPRWKLRGTGEPWMKRSSARRGAGRARERAQVGPADVAFVTSPSSLPSGFSYFPLIVSTRDLILLGLSFRRHRAVRGRNLGSQARAISQTLSRGGSPGKTCGGMCAKRSTQPGQCRRLSSVNGISN